MILDKHPPRWAPCDGAVAAELTSSPDAVTRSIASAVARLRRKRDRPLDEDTRRDLEVTASAHDHAAAWREANPRPGAFDTPLVRLADPTDAEARERRVEEWQRNDRHRREWRARGIWTDEDDAAHEAERTELFAGVAA